MTDTTTDADTKLRIRDALIAQARAELEATNDNLDDELRAAELDQDEPVRPDDTSQSDEAGELKGLLGAAAEAQEGRITAIEALDVSPADAVRPGAIVGFGGQRFLVGAATPDVEIDGVEYTGLTTDAPIYASIEGLRVGDTFTFGDREQQIDFLA